MKRLLVPIMILIFTFTASCVEADLQGIVDEFSDAIDGECSTSAQWALQTKKDGKDDKDKGDKDDDSSNDDAQDDTTVDDVATDDSTNDVDPCDSTASNSTDDASDDSSDDTSDDSASDTSEGDSGEMITGLSAPKAGWEFVGTFNEDASQGDSCSNPWGNDYGFPSSLRVFSYSDKLDFVTTTGYLAWTAQIFPDESFDFSAKFANYFGQKVVTVTCTCAVEQLYYYNDAIECACTSSNGNDMCSVRYNKI